MTLIPDIYDKIGIVLKEMQAAFGNDAIFTSSEVYPFYIQRFPEDEDLNLGGDNLKAYVSGMIWEYSKKATGKDPDKPAIEYLKEKKYRFM